MTNFRPFFTFQDKRNQFLAQIHPVRDLSIRSKPDSNILQLFNQMNPKKTPKPVEKAAKKPPLGVIFKDFLEFYPILGTVSSSVGFIKLD